MARGQVSQNGFVSATFVIYPDIWIVSRSHLIDGYIEIITVHELGIPLTNQGVRVFSNKFLPLLMWFDSNRMIVGLQCRWSLMLLWSQVASYLGLNDFALFRASWILEWCNFENSCQAYVNFGSNLIIPCLLMIPDVHRIPMFCEWDCQCWWLYSIESMFLGKPRWLGLIVIFVATTTVGTKYPASRKHLLLSDPRLGVGSSWSIDYPYVGPVFCYIYYIILTHILSPS